MESESILENEVSGHVMAWQKSGLGQMEYCRQNQLVFSRFNYWVRKLRQKEEPGAGFLTIKLKKDSGHHSTKPALELVLPGGARVNFYHPVDPAFIKSILF
jgi:hypothetical protein